MSDYRRANYIPVIGTLRLDWLRAKYINIKFLVPAKGIFVVTEAFEANLPGIAFEIFGDIELWWALALYNGIVDPIDDVSVGTRLLIPDREYLISLLETYDPNSLADAVI